MTEPGWSSTAESGSSAYRRLRRANVAVAVLLAAQAAFMLAAGNDLALPVSASFLRRDPVALRAPSAAETVFTLPIAATVAVFLLLAAVDHLAVASPMLHLRYERLIDRGANYARWIEYSVSASIMIVLIGMFVGVRDLAAIMAVFAADTAMILFGLLMERQQRPGRADWSAFWFGSLIGLVPWAIVGIYVAQAPVVPGFVYAIIATQFLLFFSFAGNMVLQYKRIGRWRSYVFGESTYITLSLTAKSLLAWLIFANVLRS